MDDTLAAQTTREDQDAFQDAVEGEQTEALTPPVQTAANAAPAQAVTTTPQPAQAAPTQAQPAVASSEQLPSKTAKLKVDPSYFAGLEKHWPEMAAHVQAVAHKYGQDPNLVGAIGYIESRWNPNVPHSPKGAQGLMQMLPSTAADHNKGNLLDVHNPFDNVELGTRYLAWLGNKYGNNTGSQVVGYFGGPGTADSVAANPALAEQITDGSRGHAGTSVAKYIAMVQGGLPAQAIHFNRGSTIDTRTLVQTGANEGPDGVLRYVTQAGPANVGLTDKFQSAIDSMSADFMARGDFAGAMHAQDWGVQMAHTGAYMHLLEARQALAAGNPMIATQQLAAAHAFFPDSTMGTFGVDGKGQIWAQAYDEHDPTKPVGPPMMVTQQGVEEMMIKTQNPRGFLQELYQHREMAEKARTEYLHGSMYAAHAGTYEAQSALDVARAGQAVGANEARVSASVHRGEGVEAMREANQQAVGGKPVKSNPAYDKEMKALFNKDETTGEVGPYGDEPLETKAKMSDIYDDARKNGATALSAERIMAGTARGQLNKAKMSDGRYGIFTKENPEQPIGYLSAGVVERHLAGAKLPQGTPQQGSAIGSAAANPNVPPPTLAGSAPPPSTQPGQSSAIPQAQ